MQLFQNTKDPVLLERNLQCSLPRLPPGLRWFLDFVAGFGTWDLNISPVVASVSMIVINSDGPVVWSAQVHCLDSTVCVVFS